MEDRNPQWPLIPFHSALPAADAEILANYIREGRFQRSLALLTEITSVVSGLEVAYDHYRGSYSRRVMYTPVILSMVLAASRACRAAGSTGFKTRSTGRPSSRRFCSGRRACWALWRACSAGVKHERTDRYSAFTRNPEMHEPIPPTPQPGYYSGYSTMGQQRFWEPATRDMVKDRVHNPPSIRHFTPEQARFWRAVFDHLLPQHDRTPEHRIPIIEPLDERLYTGKGFGFRYENMPDDREMYALGEHAIDAEARFGGGFLLLTHGQQDEVPQAIHDKQPRGAPEIWKRMSIHRFWLDMVQDVTGGYDSHPWAWNEIGFGGPAYPRPYTRLTGGAPEPWESMSSAMAATHSAII